MRKPWSRRDRNRITDDEYLAAAESVALVEFGPVTQEQDMLVLHVACDQLNRRAAA